MYLLYVHHIICTIEGYLSFIFTRLFFPQDIM